MSIKFKIRVMDSASHDVSDPYLFLDNLEFYTHNLNACFETFEEIIDFTNDLRANVTSSTPYRYLLSIDNIHPFATFVQRLKIHFDFINSSAFRYKCYIPIPSSPLRAEKINLCLPVTISPLILDMFLNLTFDFKLYDQKQVIEAIKLSKTLEELKSIMTLYNYFNYTPKSLLLPGYTDKTRPLYEDDIGINEILETCAWSDVGKYSVERLLELSEEFSILDDTNLFASVFTLCGTSENFAEKVNKRLEKCICT
jgi:hypothetical protein